ncbi:hypothetical protein GUJ93_ZPchr0012g21066 [Zizania palustris]|uniref:WRKY domain-containing protein n=1 Tax=Zizania palustris TaxID=103762 RepID=A0A8J6BXE1_ZIZPA|nr:hypothetical protein GUJ93_ZPchr0012g21066 [Zizania palustris]
MVVAAAAENSVVSSSVAAAVGGDDDERLQSAAADEGAVREVAQAYELIKTHQPLLLLLQQPQQLAHSLLSQALRALNVALSVMKLRHRRPQQPPPAAAASNGTEAEPPHLSPSASSPAADLGDRHAGIKARRAAKRRRINNFGEDKPSSWGHLTAVPYEDGYQWRKYGEKKIQGTSFTRSYFRCTYRDDNGCQATKQIQQKDGSDPPMFQVTYTKEHTCNLAAATVVPNNGDHHDDAIWSRKTMLIKQEPHADQLATTTVSNDLDETPPLHVCQDAVPPLGSKNILCIGNTSVSDEFDDHQIGQQVVETMVMLEEEPVELEADLDYYPCFSDDLYPDLLLQYGNFDHY